MSAKPATTNVTGVQSKNPIGRIEEIDEVREEGDKTCGKEQRYLGPEKRPHGPVPENKKEK